MLRMKKRLVIGLIIGLMILTVTGCGKEPPKVTDQSAAKPEAQQFIEAFGVVKSTEVKNITIDYPGRLLNREEYFFPNLRVP